MTIAEIFPAASSESISEANSEITLSWEIYVFFRVSYTGHKKGRGHKSWSSPW